MVLGGGAGIEVGWKDWGCNSEGGESKVFHVLFKIVGKKSSGRDSIPSV